MKLAFDIPFNYGDVMYNIMEIENDIVCPLCKGQGVLELVIGGHIECTKCDGRKEVNSNTFTWKVMLISKMIGIEINIFEEFPADVCITGEALSEWGNIEKRIEDDYGSQNFFDIEDCFNTLEEAQAECQRRNQPSDKKERKSRRYFD